MAHNEAQEQIDKMNWHWRNSMRPVRFFNFDARAALPFFLLLLHARWGTLFIVMFSTFIFWILEKNGLTFSSALRRLRLFFSGHDRPALMTFKKRRLRDYG
ncbi:MAG: IcmT/TraK family protein [Alphaproteobacteria bacterium]|nr:IcmT/TraK family protein [Alphaproteobacteria bacterium]